jgi:hypothetical protein
MAALQLAARAASCAGLERASCAWRSRLRCCSRASASWRSAAITASSSSAWRSCVWPAACPAPRSAPRRWRGVLPALRAGRRSRPAPLRAARGGRWRLGLLGQAQQFHVQLVGAGLRLAGLAARLHQALRRVGVGRFGRTSGERAPRRRSAPGRALAVEVFDLLRARQHAGLLGVGRVEAHRELAHRMAGAGHDDFAVRQLVALRPAPRRGSGGGVDAFEPVAQQRLQAGVVQAQQVGQARQVWCVLAMGGRAAGCRRPAWPAARRRRRRAPCRGGRPTARSGARARTASSAVSQPGSMCTWVHSPAGRPGRACASQGLSLPSVCTFSCSARSASRRAPDVRQLAASRLACSCAARRCSSSAGTCSLQLAAGDASALRVFVGHRPPAACSCARRATVRAPAGPGARRQALAAGAQLARLLVDVAAVGGQHLDLLLHLGHACAARWRGLGGAHGVFQLRQLRGLLFGLGGQHSACSSALAIWAADVFQLGHGRCPALAHCAFCACRSARRCCGALAAFDHVADALFEPAHFQRRLGQRPCSACSASLAA